MASNTRVIKSLSVICIVWLAFALRVYGVQSIPFGVDERRTIQEFVPLPISDILTTFHSNNHPFPSALAHLFSPQAANLLLMRWPMIIMGVLCLPFVYRLGTDLIDRRTGFLFLLLTALSPTLIGYSTTVRGYIGLVTLTTMSLWFLLMALKHNRWQMWLAFGAVNIIVLFFHLFGILATCTQLSVVVGWLVLGYIFPDFAQRLGLTRPSKPLLTAVGVVTLSLAMIDSVIVYSRTASILAEGGYPSDFDIWRDGLISFADVLPFITFVRSYVAPVSPGNAGWYVYSVFGAVGLIYLGQQKRGLAIGIVLWAFLSFAIVFIAVNLKPTFYAYLRFLLYLQPGFLFLIAAGITACARWLLAVSLKYDRGGRWAVWGALTLGATGLLVLMAVAIYWYLLASTHINWKAMANVITHNFQAGDIVICEEGHGFDVPDRPRSYCVWMADLMVSGLHEDTPQLLNSTSTAADYNYLYQEQHAMQQPGNVWLVRWQKLRFIPGEFMTGEKPRLLPLQELSGFEPFQTWNFGSATLVHVNQGKLLLDNVREANKLLAQDKQASLANKARYYRNLTQIEAVQGHKQAAVDYYQQAWATVELAGGQYPDLFLMDTYSLIKRLPNEWRVLPPNVTRIGHRLGSSLCLAGYQVLPNVIKAGEQMKLRLYWQVNDLTTKDYRFFLQLRTQNGQYLENRLEFDPFDRTYPTPWWWLKQQLVEQHVFTIPSEIPAQNYVLEFGLYDLHTGGDESKPLFQMKRKGADSVQWELLPAPAVNECALH